MPIRHLSKLRRLAVNELSSELDRRGQVRRRFGEDAATDPIACLENDNVPARFGKVRRCGEACDTSTNHGDVDDWLVGVRSRLEHCWPAARYKRFFRDDFLFRGTFAPFFRASDRPIAIACFRLLTFPPLPPLPDLSVPLFRRCIALLTRLLADLPYFRPLSFCAATGTHL